MSNSEINLIQKDVGSFRKLSFVEEKLRMATWWFLGSLLVIGVAIGLSYVLLSARTKALEAKKIDLTRQINSQTVKEGILLSLKDRTVIAGKALDAARQWGKLFPLLGEIANESNYNALSVEESGRVTTTLNLVNIDDAVAVVSNTMILVRDKKMRSPQLGSFTFKEDSSVQLTISFSPVL